MSKSGLVKVFKVLADNTDLRLEKFIQKIFKNYSYTFIQKLIRKGQIRVNQKRIKPGYVLSTNDEVRVPSYDQPSSSEEPRKVNQLSPKEKEILEQLNKLILYEDSHILVLNKPKGLAVQGGKGIRYSIDSLLPYIQYKIKQPDFSYKLRLVHRLDKTTSGVLLIAKTNYAAKNIGNQFNNREIQKQYLCIAQVFCINNINNKTISTGIVKCSGTNNKSQVSCMHSYTALPKEAITEINTLVATKLTYTLKDNSEQQCGFALLEVNPKTGRNHQIRVHLGEVQHTPILGDVKYGYRSINSEINNLIKNQVFLHAYSITFINSEQQRITIKSDIPDDWLEILQAINLKFIKP